MPSGVPLRNIYGMTEIAFSPCIRRPLQPRTVGHWLVAHPESGALLEWKVSEQGELLIRGGSFFQGYYNKPDSIAQRVREGWYHTGDAVSLTDSGELVFLERLDDLRRLRSGERFPPQFIETRLRFSPFIKDIMTLGDDTRDYIGALINIDMSVVSRWAEDRNISFSTFTDLSQKAEVAELVREEIGGSTLSCPARPRPALATSPKSMIPTRAS